eukprot:scaffold104738_cov67-Phaeocystis_antarctica.AAC.6
MTPKASSLSDSLTVPVLFCGAKRQASGGPRAREWEAEAHTCRRSRAPSRAHQQVIPLLPRAGVGEGVFRVVVDHIGPLPSYSRPRATRSRLVSISPCRRQKDADDLTARSKEKTRTDLHSLELRVELRLQRSVAVAQLAQHTRLVVVALLLCRVHEFHRGLVDVRQRWQGQDVLAVHHLVDHAERGAPKHYRRHN